MIRETGSGGGVTHSMLFAITPIDASDISRGDRAEALPPLAKGGAGGVNGGRSPQPGLLSTPLDPPFLRGEGICLPSEGLNPRIHGVGWHPTSLTTTRIDESG